jgi:hypothetical protein
MTFTTLSILPNKLDNLLAMLLLLRQSDDWHAVMPNNEDRDGLKDPKFVPPAVTITVPVNGIKVLGDVMFEADAE